MPTLPARYAFLRLLVDSGVRHLFGNPGTTEEQVLDAIQDFPELRYVLCLHECVAVAAADAYARATATIGVVNIHIAGGLANGLSQVINAQRGGTPLLVTAGQQDTRFLAEEPILTANLVDLAKPLTKWSIELTRPEDLPLITRRALKLAQSPPTGPVFLSLPMNLMDEVRDFDLRPPTVVPARSRADAEALERAVALLSRAQHPVILCGDGVAQSDAQSDLARLAETLGATVHTTSRTSVNFPTTHGLYGGLLNVNAANAPELIAGADVVLAIGTALFAPYIYHSKPILPENARVIHVDSSAWELGKNVPVDVAVLADPREAIRELNAALARELPPASRAAATERREQGERRARDRQARLAAELAGLEQPAGGPETGHPAVAMSIRQLMLAVRAGLPSDAILADESVSASPTLHDVLDFTEPDSYFGIRGGSLGWALGAAVGLSFARPERPIVALCGDGAANYQLPAIWTAAHYRLPILFVILNNKSYRILKLNVLQWLGEGARGREFVGLDLTEPDIDFVRIAEGYGVPAQRVASPVDLRDAVRAAATLTGPRLLEVSVDGSVPKP